MSMMNDRYGFKNQMTRGTELAIMGSKNTLLFNDLRVISAMMQSFCNKD
jgi:hypothetical protein